MSTPFRIRANACAGSSLGELNDPIGLVATGGIELHHLDCAGGRCQLVETKYKESDYSNEVRSGYQFVCRACADTSSPLPSTSIIRGLRRAVLQNEETSLSGWVDMKGIDPDPRGSARSSHGAEAPPKQLQQQLLRVHFLDGSSRELIAARYVLRYGSNNETHLFDANNEIVASYAAGVVLGIESVHAYPSSDA